jgi:hypothetical protein
MLPCASLATLETAPKYGLERAQLLVMSWMELSGHVGDVNRAERIDRHNEGIVQLVQSVRYGGRRHGIETHAGVRRGDPIGSGVMRERR